MILSLQGDMMPSLGTNVIVLSDDKILLTLRNDVPVWCLPGGGIDARESVAQCAVREVFEETGLLVELKELIGIYSRPFWGLDGDHVVVFTAVPVGGDLQPEEAEVSDIGYFAADELPELLLWWHQQRIEDALNGRRGLAATQNVLWPFGEMTRAELHEHQIQGQMPVELSELVQTLATSPSADALRYEVG
jgi:ADP-ribose pyrophosphatase YjhB (NUDIX family)